MRNDALEKVLIWLSEKDPWCALDACEGTLITGSPGSGKSSTAAKEIAYRFLEAGYGGLVLCHKVDEPERWLGYCEKTGRSRDVIYFSADSGHCYDFLSYEWKRPGKGAADVETLIQMLTMLTGVGQGGSGDNKFWEAANRKLMRHVIKLIGLSGEPLSIDSMNKVIQSLPAKEGEFESAEFHKHSECARMFAAIQARADVLTAPEWNDLSQAMTFLLFKWPRLATETSSSVEMHWATLADQFLFEPFRSLFCSGRCTFIPEQTTHEVPGKIVIVGFPTLEYGETGSIINRLIKVSFQRAWLRRDVNKYPSIVFCFQDEFQTFLTPGSSGASWDNNVQQVCRSARVANVCITQNILNLAEVLGESNHAGPKTKAFLGNLMLKVMHQQSDVDTNVYCADLIGKEYRYLQGTTMGAREPSVSQNQHLAYRIEPDEFSRLEKPDTEICFAGTILYQGGKLFSATGLNYHRRLFSRDLD